MKFTLSLISPALSSSFFFIIKQLAAGGGNEIFLHVKTIRLHAVTMFSRCLCGRCSRRCFSFYFIVFYISVHFRHVIK